MQTQLDKAAYQKTLADVLNAGWMCPPRAYGRADALTTKHACAIATIQCWLGIDPTYLDVVEFAPRRPDWKPTLSLMPF